MEAILCVSAESRGEVDAFAAAALQAGASRRSLERPGRAGVVPRTGAIES
jgi:predicted lactoylglutathione lyase